MMLDPGFERLTSAWLNGDISPEDAAALEKLLFESAAARSTFRQYAQLDTVLHDSADASGEFSLAGQVEPRSDVSRSADRSFGSATISLNRHVWQVALGISAALLLTFGVPLLLPKVSDSIAERDPGDVLAASKVARVSMPPAPAATLTSQADSLWDGPLISDGQALFEGETIHLQRGKARISVGVGAEIAMTGPCVLTFTERDRVLLGLGEITVHVAEWAKGFTVATDNMDVVDLGTTFTVSASQGDKDETRVIKGLVRVHPRLGENSEQRGLLISEGEGLTIHDGRMRKDSDVGPLPKVDLLGVEGVRPYRPIAVHNTGLGLSVGDEDPNWRVIAGPASNFSGPEYAAVCSPDARYMANDPSTSQWVSMENWQRAAPDSVYTFETTFDLTGYELSTIQLFGRFLADNGIEEVRVNGKPVKVESWGDNVRGQSFGDPQFRFVNVTDVLVQGRNVVEVDVWNGVHFSRGRAQPSVLNPSALRVEWYAFGREVELASHSLQSSSPQPVDGLSLALPGDGERIPRASASAFPSF